MIELVMYGSNDFDSSWWPLDHESTFNELVDVAEGCKVPVVTCRFPASAAPAPHSALCDALFR